MKKIALLGLCSVLATGCATQTYVLAEQTQEQRIYSKAQTFYVSGIAQQQAVNAAAVCNGADNVTTIKTKLTFKNGVLGHLTQGIYTPRQIMVYCK